MKTTPNHGLSYVEGNDKPADYPLISQENMTKLDTLIQQLIDGKSPLSHNHSMGQVTGLDTALAGKAPTSHTHTMGQVTGLDTALAGKAPTSHTHTMGQVTGLDTALAGKANQTTMDTRVPSTLALRLDTTVGTRIFAGDTMIHGDTGWRNIKEWFTPHLVFENEFHWATVKRVGYTVTLEVQSTIGTTSIFLSNVIPVGFRPPQRYSRSIGTGSLGDTVELIRTNANFNFLNAVPVLTGKTGTFSFTTTWETRDNWPTTLPGLPA